ncbi:hypothetical protein [Leifsonia aquatica]|uniref:hypothetical protein n=1 Tax=Leifsonia aquatica TaxID=144185 RepID=UPI0004681DEC|nr:hypothetical protein [Leifsonia aquatica]
MKLRTRIAAVALAGAALVATLAGCAPTTDEVTHGQACHVDSKDHTIDKDGNGVYRVYTSDCGILNVEDAPFLGRYNSADIYASIQPHHAYLFTTYGHRNGFLSTFPNITEAIDVTQTGE